MIPLLAMILAALVTALLIRPLSRHASRLGLMDYPDGNRRINTRAVPRIGGIAIVASSIGTAIAMGPTNRPFAAYLIAVVVLLVFGVLDDRRGLSARTKFIGQIIAALIVIFGGGITVTNAPFLGLNELPPMLGAALTLLALLAITNAVNLSDGLDGLAGGMMFLTLCVIGLLAYEARHPGLVVGASIVAGATLGFLRYNSYPAWIFMGDTGSQFLGFSAGVFTIVLTQDVNPALSPALPFLLLGLPVFDTVLVMFYRWRNERPLFVADNNHTHHRLLSLGFFHYEAVLIIYLAQALLVSVAFLLRYESDWVVAGAYIVFFCGAAVTLRQLSRSEWTRGEPGVLSRLLAEVEKFRESKAHARWPQVLMASTVVVLFAIGGYCFSTTRDDALIATVLALGIAVFGLGKNDAMTLLERGTLFATAAFFAFKITGSHQPPVLDRVLDVLVVMIVGAFVLSVRYAGRETVFKMSPLDFLVVFIVITVAALGKLGVIDPTLGNTLAFVIIPCYAIEFGSTEK